MPLHTFPPALLFSAWENCKARAAMVVSQDANILDPWDSAGEELPAEPLDLTTDFVWVKDKFLYFRLLKFPGLIVSVA